MLLLVHLSLRCAPCSAHPAAVLVSAAVVSCTVLRRVCGVWWCVSVCGLCVVGYPLCAPPSSWWWVGALWMVGWRCGVGRLCDGRAAV